MKTKYILHGGFAPGKKQQDDNFFQEILRDLPDSANVLLVYFAEPDEKVRLRTEQDREEFEKNRNSKKLTFKVASEASFEKDCAWANAIYLHGGKTLKIMESLTKYPNIKQILSGKTIAGDSAGAHALGEFFYSKNSKVTGKGLGILSLKIMAHYEDSMKNPLAELEPQLESVLMREYETKVIMA